MAEHLVERQRRDNDTYKVDFWVQSLTFDLHCVGLGGNVRPADFCQSSVGFHLYANTAADQHASGSAYCDVQAHQTTTAAYLDVGGKRQYAYAYTCRFGRYAYTFACAACNRWNEDDAPYVLGRGWVLAYRHAIFLLVDCTAAWLAIMTCQTARST
jgi:hypothetical protein